MMTIDHSETAAYLHCELGLTDFSSKILAAILLIADRTDGADIFYITSIPSEHVHVAAVLEAK